MVEKDGGRTVRVSVVDDTVVRLGRVLSTAAPTILVAVKRKVGAVDPEVLPDAELTLGGDLLPAGLLGHGQWNRGDRRRTPGLVRGASRRVRPAGARPLDRRTAAAARAAAAAASALYIPPNPKSGMLYRVFGLDEMGWKIR